MSQRSAHTRPPAKLNVFLELLGRREDGYHEIDTVMVPIDWCDELTVRRCDQPGVRLNVNWLPSIEIVAQRLGIQQGLGIQQRLGIEQRLGIDLDDTNRAGVLAVPTDESNLVHRAITRFSEAFGIEGGFECDLGKRIPAGAGMGGASSDAASALRCCAALCEVPLSDPQLWEIAASIGSDVPFFLGVVDDTGLVAEIRAGRATGRGEVLQAATMGMSLDAVVVYPGVSLSTAKVYAECQVPQNSISSEEILLAISRGDLPRFRQHLTNRLTTPAKKLAPEIEEILEALWRDGLRTCQLTGSGSACFAIASSPAEAHDCATRVQAMLEPGAIVMAAQGTRVPARVVVRDNANSTD